MIKKLPTRLGRQLGCLRRYQHTSTAAPSSEQPPPVQTSNVPFFRLAMAPSEGLKLKRSEFDHIPLRDACQCTRCVDPSTRQREFDYADIPYNIEGDATKTPNGSWKVKWKNDIPGYENHISTFTPEQLSRLKRNSRLASTRLWDKDTFQRETSTVDFPTFMSSDKGLAKALFLLARHGLVFVNNIPDHDPDAIVSLAERMAPLRNTFYGTTWNVKSEPQAKNVAYTHKHLGFHMDLMYLRESPNIQLLHCLQNSCTGGESRFVDTFKALDILQSENPQMGNDLRRARVRYEYDNDGHYYSDVKPIVEVANSMEMPSRRSVIGHRNSMLGNVRRIYWSPPFVGSIWAEYNENPEATRRKLDASKAFAEILEREELVYEEKMEPGTCMVFNNLRVLHARNAFDINSGKRWLRGCYLDGQDITSKELKLSQTINELEREMYPPPPAPKGWGN